MDIAVCTFEVEGDDYSFHLDLAGQVDFDDSWKARLQHLIDQSAEVYAKTNVYFGHWMGRELRAFIEAHQAKSRLCCRSRPNNLPSTSEKLSPAKLATERPLFLT